MSETIVGSFEWAIQQLKAGKRANRQGWGNNIFLLRNPGLPGQKVVNDDFRAKAGVAVDTPFNYLPNIEICNPEGDYVPWTPTHVDMEAMDWGVETDIQEVDPSKHMLVLDIKNGYKNIGGQVKEEWWGYDYKNVNSSGDHYIGSVSVVEDNINLIYTSPYIPVSWFRYSESTQVGQSRKGNLSFSLNFSGSTWVEMRDLLQGKSIRVTVDDEVFDLGIPYNASFGDAYKHVLYTYIYSDLNALPGLIAKMKENNILKRYSFDWYTI